MKIIIHCLLLTFSLAMILTNSTVFAATVAQMKACKMSVLEQTKFKELPMADVCGGLAKYQLSKPVIC